MFLFPVAMMDKSNMKLQKEMHIVVDPLSLKRPSLRKTCFETTTTTPLGVPASNDSHLHLPPPLQPSKHIFLSSTMPSSANSSPQNLESPSKVSNLTRKNKQQLQQRSMSGGKRMEDDGFKCCMCLPGFGKAKAVKVRKEGIEMGHSVNPEMSSTFSFEVFELNSKVTQAKIVSENNEDDSISSYFELPSNKL